MIASVEENPVRSPSPHLESGAWGVVFCGGESRRMGHDKARLRLGGTSLVERAARELGSLTPEVLLASGSTARYPELGLECVLDALPGAGPLAGLQAVLERLATDGVEYACVLACDMPNASAETFRRLLAHARRTEADLCLVATEKGDEPLCGVYHVRVLPAVRRALKRGERRMNAFHGEVEKRSLAADELGRDCARNLNTPEEFLGAGGSFE